jgi:hypothetical protein
MQFRNKFNIKKQYKLQMLISIHRYGYKILKDEKNFYLCLLQTTQNSRIIANDIKYRTNEANIISIKKLHDKSFVDHVNHISFYSSDIRKEYKVNYTVCSELDESKNICAAGIHFFAFYGYSGDYIFSLFPQIYKENCIYILMTWHLEIISKYISISNIIKLTNEVKNPLIVINEYNELCNIMKKLL